VVFSFRLSALVCVCYPHSASFATRHSLGAIAGSDSPVAFSVKTWLFKYEALS